VVDPRKGPGALVICKNTQDPKGQNIWMGGGGVNLRPTGPEKVWIPCLSKRSDTTTRKAKSKSKHGQKLVNINFFPIFTYSNLLNTMPFQLVRVNIAT